MEGAFAKILLLAAMIPTVSLAAKSDFQSAGAARLLPAAGEISGWASGGPPESYEGEGLYGYINGGSEIFLQYGFKRVDVGRYKKESGGAGPEVTVDLYRMGSPLDAFGIFSVRRQGGEKTLDLGHVPNWISESQASLAAGVYFVNIIGFETQSEDIPAFARLLAKKLAAPGEKPCELDGAGRAWSVFPLKNLLPDTVRLIKGPLAAREESEFLAPDFWKFAAGTVAASAKYAPDGRKLIVVDFANAPSGLMTDVRKVFAEYLTDIREEGGMLSAKNGLGHVYLCAAQGRRACLVFGKKDAAAARILMAEALGNGSL